MKCKVCGGAGVIQGQAPGLVSCCPACNGTGVVEESEITNYNYIHNCNSIDELADEIFKCVLKNQWIINKEKIVEWLKQPHNRKEK